MDCPKELGSPEFQTRHGTLPMSLMWSTTKPLWGRGKTVVMDSGFYVLIGLYGMFKC